MLSACEIMLAFEPRSSAYRVPLERHNDENVEPCLSAVPKAALKKSNADTIANSAALGGRRCYTLATFGPSLQDNHRRESSPVKRPENKTARENGQRRPVGIQQCARTVLARPPQATFEGRLRSMPRLRRPTWINQQHHCQQLFRWRRNTLRVPSCVRRVRT